MAFAAMSKPPTRARSGLVSVVSSSRTNLAFATMSKPCMRARSGLATTVARTSRAVIPCWITGGASITKMKKLASYTSSRAGRGTSVRCQRRRQKVYVYTSTVSSLQSSLVSNSSQTVNHATPYGGGCRSSSPWTAVGMTAAGITGPPA